MSIVLSQKLEEEKILKNALMCWLVMSGKHQIFVYRCKNCREKTKTMDSKNYVQHLMEDYPDTYSCCKNPELEITDQFFKWLFLEPVSMPFSQIVSLLMIATGIIYIVNKSPSNENQIVPQSEFTVGLFLVITGLMIYSLKTMQVHGIPLK